MRHKIPSKIIFLFAFMLICSLGTRLNAQNPSTLIYGVVQNEFGEPLPGAIVKSGYGENQALTNVNGEYKLAIDDGSKSLIFTASGYSKKTEKIGEKSQINVQLKLGGHNSDEVVQLGYTSQLRSEISGAVATVSGEELEKSPITNLSQSFAGRLSGLTTQETFSEPSRASTSLFIRGISAARTSTPVVVIDGMVCAYNPAQTLEYISPGEIESITILKDASTEAIYGIQGANGLIVITTKRGKQGDLKIRTRVDQSVEQVTTKPTIYNSAEYATMRNQAAFNDGKGLNYFYTDDEIDKFSSGENKNLYPNNNWYNMFMKDFTTQQRIGVDASGGNEQVQFYSNVNFMHQGGMFKTDQTKYNPNGNDVWVNYRTNVDMKLNRYLKAFVHLSGNIKRERTSGTDINTVYGSIFQLPPTMYGPVTPKVVDATGTVLSEGGDVVTSDVVSSPTYGLLNRTGYIRHTVTNINSHVGLDLDMSFLTKGLSLTGMFAYQTNSVGHLSTTQDYERYQRTALKDTLTFTKKGSNINSTLAYSKTHSFYYHLSYKTAMNYNRTYGLHKVGGMAYVFYQSLTKTATTSPDCLPYNRFSSGVEASYGYDDRYLLKFDLGYSGSEQYARGSRYLTTPAISGAWVASNEAFMKNLQWITNLKVRASYGKTGNDQSGLSRYSYLDNVTVSSGGNISSLQYTITEGQVANPYIQAEVSKKQNYGIDLGLFNSLSVSVDLFKERMSNMVVTAISTIPLYQGVVLSNYPDVNSGTFENKGYDITANYTKAINKDLTVSVGGMFSYVENTIIDKSEALKDDDYAYRKWEEGFSYGQTFGYLVDYSNGNGFFNSKDEITNSNLAYSFGTPRVGDLKYQDLNSDGKIDVKDKAPIGTGTIPRITYAISGGLTYKSFDFSFLFQGVGTYSSIYSGMGIYETSYSGVFGALHQNAWTQERYDNGEKITAPALSLTTSTSHQTSDYYNYDKSYIRLKNLEIGYTLPSSITKAISADKVRFVLSGQNLLTWDKMKSKDFGPEGSYSSIPVYRIFNIGVSLDF